MNKQNEGMYKCIIVYIYYRIYLKEWGCWSQRPFLLTWFNWIMEKINDYIHGLRSMKLDIHALASTAV